MTQTESKNRKQSPFSNPKINYYEMLGVERMSSPAQIREAYHKIKNTYKETCQAMYSLVDFSEAGKNLAGIEEAYRILRDPERRKQYDEALGIALYKNVYDQNSYFDAHETRAKASLESNVYSQAEEKICQSAKSTAHMLCAVNKSCSNFGEEVNEILAEAPFLDGVVLSSIRNLCGVTREDIQENTKISMHHIQNIEENRFDLLPQKVYVRGFLKNYLRYLALENPDILVDRYLMRMDDWKKNRN